MRPRRARFDEAAANELREHIPSTLGISVALGIIY